jgi:assimilatory nitrate reductase catalytic subunit
VAVDWRAFLIVRGIAALPDCLWATKVAVANGTLFELAGTGKTGAIDRLLPRGERIEAADPARGTRRVAVLDKGCLIAVLFLTRDGELPPRDWLVTQLGQPQGLAVLAGRAPGAWQDSGPVICACLNVGLNSIVAAIRDQQLASVADIGAALSAGTNCGSCRPALSRILATQIAEAAHAG